MREIPSSEYNYFPGADSWVAAWKERKPGAFRDAMKAACWAVEEMRVGVDAHFPNFERTGNGDEWFVHLPYGDVWECEPVSYGEVKPLRALAQKTIRVSVNSLGVEVTEGPTEVNNVYPTVSYEGSGGEGHLYQD